MRRAFFGLVVCCILTAGCITDGQGGSSGPPSATTSPSETLTQPATQSATTSPSAPPTTTLPTTPTPTSEPTPRPDPTPAVNLTSAGTECSDSLFVAFWGLSEDTFWTQDTVRVGYYLPPNTSILLVTYIDGRVEGVTARNNTYGDGINDDGDELDLKTRLSGTHVVRTVIYRDTDRDGEFSEETDVPCLVDGEVVQAGPTRVNFSRFG